MPDTELKISIVGDASGAKAVLSDTGEQVIRLKVSLDDAGDAGQKAGKALAEGAEASGASMMEARHSVMLLGEEMGVHVPRAVATLIAGVGPLGSVLAAAFPILGAVALLDIVGKLAEKHDAYAAAVRKARDEAENLAIKQQDEAEQLELENLKLEDQVNKLEKRPTTNKLAEALLESKVKADDLASSLQEVLSKSDETFSEQTSWTATAKDAFGELWDGIKTGSLTTGAIVVATQNESDKQMIASIRSVQKAQEEVNQARMKMADAKTVDQQKSAILGLADAYAGLHDKAEAAYTATKTAAPDNVKALSALTQTVTTAASGIRDMEEMTKQLSLSQKVATLESTVDMEAAAQARKQQMDDEVTKAKQLLDVQQSQIKSQLASQKEAYAEGKMGAADWAAAQTKADDDAYAAQIAYFEKLKTIYTQAYDFQKLSATAVDENKFILDANAKALDEAAAEQEKFNQATRNAAFEGFKDSIKQADDGLKQTDDRMKGLLAQIYELQGKPVIDDTKLPPLEKKLQDLRDRLAAIKQEEEQMQTTLAPLNSAFSNAFSSWIVMGKSFGQTFSKDFQQIELQAVRSLANIGVSMLEHLAIAELMGNREQISAAKVAASNTYAQAAGIPVIGPFVAPLMAASAFAGAMAFDTGGMSEGGLALLHPREAVLNPVQTENFRQMTEDAGGDTHHHYNSTINAMDSHSFENFLKRNPAALSAGIMHASKNGHLSARELARGK